MLFRSLVGKLTETLCLRDGTDREQSVSVNLPTSAVIQFAPTDNPTAVLVHKADDHAGIPLFNLDSLLQERVDRIGEFLRRGWKRNRTENQRKTDESDDLSDVHVSQKHVASSVIPDASTVSNSERHKKLPGIPFWQ